MARIAMVVSLVTLLQRGALSTLDRPLVGLKIPATFEPCEIHAVVEMLGRAANVPVGFEAGADCDMKSSAEKLAGWMNDEHVTIDDGGIELGGAALHAALDAVIERAPDYAWKEIGGVIVVRPKAAWNNVWDPLTVPFRSQEQARQLDEALTRVFAAHHRAPVTTKGTLLERLNTAAVADGAGQWDVSKISPPETAHGPGPFVAIVFRAGGPPNGGGMSTWTSIPLMTSERDENQTAGDWQLVTGNW